MRIILKEAIDMSARNLTLDQVMTPAPYSIRHDATLSEAEKMMADHSIRHLVVKKEGELVGLITERDLHRSRAYKGFETIYIEDFMATDVYAVLPTARLGPTVLEMAQRKCGSVVVEDDGKVVGIFTAVDALRVLGEVLSG